MMKSIAQSLAGRISILNLLPLSKLEIEQKPAIAIEHILTVHSQHSKFANIENLWEFVLKGGYPEVITTPQVFSFWFNDYVKTYLERDVRRIINVQDLTTFQRFIKLCAGRTGNILNKASLASDCGISETTCTKWLSLLEQSGIIMLLKPYFNNFNKRQTKSVKLHFLDTGLCCHLLWIKNIEHLITHPLLGAILETYVIAELHKQYFNNGENIEFYYWRDQHGKEIDLIIELANGKILPIEIKAGQTITSNLIQPLLDWCELAQIDRGILLYGGSEYQVRTTIDIIPISAVL
jgi:predicted AAA+ superfamily ATPase